MKNKKGFHCLVFFLVSMFSNVGEANDLSGTRLFRYFSILEYQPSKTFPCWIAHPPTRKDRSLVVIWVATQYEKPQEARGDVFLLKAPTEESIEQCKQLKRGKKGIITLRYDGWAYLTWSDRFMRSHRTGLLIVDIPPHHP